MLQSNKVKKQNKTKHQQQQNQNQKNFNMLLKYFSFKPDLQTLLCTKYICMIVITQKH